MDKDIPRFCLDFDQRVLDKELSKDTHRIFKRNIVQILILMLGHYLCFNVLMLAYLILSQTKDIDPSGKSNQE